MSEIEHEFEDGVCKNCSIRKKDLYQRFRLPAVNYSYSVRRPCLPDWKSWFEEYYRLKELKKLAAQSRRISRTVKVET